MSFDSAEIGDPMASWGKSKTTKSNIIDQIQEIRSKNNKNWMDMLRLAFKYAPQEARLIMGNITSCDGEVTELTKQLANEKE